MNEPVLTAGVARADITPPVGFRMQGMMRRIEPSVGIESPLLATVLVLADENTKIVIYNCDLIGFDLPLSNEIRQVVGERVGTPPSHVFLCCTHTHNGPCTARGILGGVHDVDGDPHERAALDAYIANLTGQLAGIAALADRNRQAVRAVAGKGYASVAINREERDTDGRILVGRNPEGPTDQSVDVLRVDDLNGHSLAVLVSYAAHPVVMGLETYLLSPDYPGVVRRIVEQVTGAKCLFLTGASGNQATLSFLQADWDEQERMGGLVAAGALQAFYTTETRPHQTIREFGVSLSNLALYQKVLSDGPSHKILKVANRQIDVLLQPLPSLEQANENLATASANLLQLKQENALSTKTYPARLVERWAEGVYEKVRAGIIQESLSIEISGFRLDDFILLAMPGEPFVEIGLKVKKLSKAKNTMFLGYCNGVLAYWPTEETVTQGGMAVESSVRTYNISAPPVASAAEDIVKEFRILLDELGC